MATAYSIQPLMGVDPSDTSDLATGSLTVYSPEFALGARIKLSDGGETMYIKAGAAITAGDVLLINSTGSAVGITTALCDKGGTTPQQYIGVANTTLASGQHGWACTGGIPIAGISVAASCVRGSPLYTTTGAGILDDTDSSSHLISGIQTTVTATGAAVVAGFVTTPLLVSGVVNNT
jgi:hypothetical protein